MKLKALANLPTAFLAGAGVAFAFRVVDLWASGHRPGREVSLLLGLTLLVGPLVMFVIGIDPERWKHPNYAVSQGFVADYKKILLRGAAYYVGSLLMGAILK